MQSFAFGAHTLVVMLEIAALLVLVALGLVADAYWPRKKLAAMNIRASCGRAARPTLAAWHRAAWRRVNPRAACTMELRRLSV